MQFRTAARVSIPYTRVMTSEASAVPNGNVADAGELPAQRLERMKHEFLVAQQRRRERAPAPASRPAEPDAPDAPDATVATCAVRDSAVSRTPVQ